MKFHVNYCSLQRKSYQTPSVMCSKNDWRWFRWPVPTAAAFLCSTAGRGEGLKRAGYTRSVWNIQPPPVCSGSYNFIISLRSPDNGRITRPLCTERARTHKPLLCERERESGWVSESEILRRSREYNNDADADKKENTCNIYSGGVTGPLPSRSFQIVVYPWA